MNKFLRRTNTTRTGGAWPQETKLKVWRMASPIVGLPSAAVRKDACGKVIKWSEYGNRNSLYGWEIDHIFPVALGGGDLLFNLQPLYWKHNASKGDSLNWSCPVKKAS